MKIEGWLDMEVGEVRHPNTEEPYEVFRVPGGWMVTRLDTMYPEAGTACFVPLHPGVEKKEQ